MYYFIFLAQVINAREHFFDAWDKKEVSIDKHSPYTYILNDLKDQNENLFKIACSLTVIYPEAHLQQENTPNICELLNEWLNIKKKMNTDDTKNSEITKLWENYVEKLWLQLENDSNRYYWCRRTFPASTIVNPLSFSFTVSIFVVIIFFIIYNVI